MKKFIFGVMLLVSLLGIVGCSNPSNSDGSENVIYIVKNGLTDQDSNSISMTISYKNKSGVYANKQTIPANGTYEIPASDVKIVTVVISTLNFTTGKTEYIEVPVVQFNVNGVEGYLIKAELEKGVKIKGVATNNGGFTNKELIENSKR